MSRRSILSAEEIWICGEIDLRLFRLTSRKKGVFIGIRRNAHEYAHLRRSICIFILEIDHWLIDQSQNSFRKSNSGIKEHSNEIVQVYIEKFFPGIRRDRLFYFFGELLRYPLIHI